MWLGIFVASLGYLLSACAVAFLPPFAGSLAPAAVASVVLAWETRAAPFGLVAIGLSTLTFDAASWGLLPWIAAGMVTGAYPLVLRDWSRLLAWAVGLAGFGFATFVTLVLFGLPGNMALIPLWISFFASLAACAVWYQRFESSAVYLAAAAIFMYMLAALVFFVPNTPNAAAAVFPLVLFHGVTCLAIAFMFYSSAGTMSRDGLDDDDDDDVYFTPLDPK